MSVLLSGLALSAIIAVAAYRLGSLSASGVLGAVLVGTLTLSLGGWAWGTVLIAFFVSSSLLSRYGEERKRALAEKFAKGGRRDLAQVLANGGLAALLAVLHAFQPGFMWWVAFLGSLAAVSADTWATELGVLSPGPPRLITTGQRVARGTSGGVSTLGMIATLAGGAFIALLGAVAPESAGRAGLVFLSAWVAGIAGSLLDSGLGATVQAMYYCAEEGVETERVIHTCGRATQFRRGWRWLNNEGVNLISSLSGTLIALALLGVLV
ncbi:MAG: DUF92 domain-containing protein [Chloroflexi bacterium]|nr:DUF92 domain-containing protein [Chloroflexota bacterium]